MRPIYDKVLDRSGVLDHSHPAVMDVFGGGGILFQRAKERGAVWDYHMVDSDRDVRNEAERHGIVATNPTLPQPLPGNPGRFDHAFWVLPPNLGIATRGMMLEGTLGNLKANGRFTLLSQ